MSRFGVHGWLAALAAQRRWGHGCWRGGVTLRGTTSGLGAAAGGYGSGTVAGSSECRRAAAGCGNVADRGVSGWGATPAPMNGLAAPPTEAIIRAGGITLGWLGKGEPRGVGEPPAGAATSPRPSGVA